MLKQLNNKINFLRIDVTTHKTIEEDYSNFIKYLINNNICPEENKQLIEKNIKNIHFYIYSICMWSNAYDNEIIHKHIYLTQMRSDAIQSLYLSLIGFQKPVKLLLRNLIEDLLNHIYYYDHKIEYERLNYDKKFYNNISDLWEYLKNHPDLKNIINKNESMSNIKQKYSELSKYVHSQNTEHMHNINTIDELKFNINFFNEYMKEIIQIIDCINYFLFIFYKINNNLKTELTSHMSKLIPKEYKKSMNTIL